MGAEFALIWVVGPYMGSLPISLFNRNGQSGCLHSLVSI